MSLTMAFIFGAVTVVILVLAIITIVGVAKVIKVKKDFVDMNQYITTQFMAVNRNIDEVRKHSKKVESDLDRRFDKLQEYITFKDKVTDTSIRI